MLPMNAIRSVTMSRLKKRSVAGASAGVDEAWGLVVAATTAVAGVPAVAATRSSEMTGAGTARAQATTTSKSIVDRWRILRSPSEGPVARAPLFTRDCASGPDARAGQDDRAVVLPDGGRHQTAGLVDHGAPRALVLHALQHQPPVRPLDVGDGRGACAVDRAEHALRHVDPKEGW